VDGADDGESHYDKTHVDGEGKVRCELVHPVTADDFGKIVFSNKHMHA